VTSLVVGDDHAVFLDALSSVLAQRGFDLTITRSLAETVEMVGRKQPDLCLIDRHFAADDSVTAIAAMLAASPNTKVLVLSADPQTEGILAALQAGAAGYLHKTRGITALMAAINRVLTGEVVVDVPRAPSHPRPPGQDDARRLAAQLTGRERQCLSLLVEGLDTVAIARKLSVSQATVRAHIQSVLTKLGVHSRLEAASFAVRYHLLDDEPRHASSHLVTSGVLLGRSGGRGATAGWLSTVSGFRP
jgi:two-component system, NarL family, nitrate/nitrite response regulator NarL